MGKELLLRILVKQDTKQQFFSHYGQFHDNVPPTFSGSAV